jgi:F-type H+-transporting ATPase subunit gamma
LSSLREVRTRIQAIQKTQKITRAMYLISAARMARAQAAVLQARPYARKLAEVMGAISQGVEADAHPLLVARPDPRKLDVVVLTSNRGLCGAYNINVIKLAEALVRERRAAGLETALFPVGRRAADHFRRRRLAEIPRAWTELRTVTPEDAAEIASTLQGRFLRADSDGAVLAYSTFVSALTQRPGVEQLLPIRAAAAQDAPVAPAPIYEVEPGPAELLAQLLPQAVEFRVYRALLEQQACEHAARMTAMDSATRNTEELTRALTIEFNKQRQASITAELVEIVGGAEAL